MTPQEAEAVLRLVTVPGRGKPLPIKKFQNMVGVDDAASWTLEQLHLAIDRRDGEDVELALVVASLSQLDEAWLEPLHALCRANWHESHESVVNLLADLANPSSVEALSTLAWHTPDHLAFDDSHALARKVVHALGNLGTDQARDVVREVASSGPEAVREVAHRQLAKMQA